MTSSRILTILTILLSLTPGLVGDARAVLGDAYTAGVADSTDRAFASNTPLVKRKLPPGTYVVMSSGVIRSVSTTLETPMVCVLFGGGNSSTLSNFSVPTVTNANAGGGTWSLLTTVTVPPPDGLTVSIQCQNLGQAPDSDLFYRSPNLVAIKVGNDIRKTLP